MSTPAFPARLHVLLARDAPYGVVIRRGPSKQVCLVGWNRENDTFKLGQWLKGRIYEHRSDLSPDGKHLIYFAMDGRWRSETKGSWTAVSRAPYLKAIGLWAKGDCWYGGGLWTDKKTFWVSDFNSCLNSIAGEAHNLDGHEKLREPHGLKRSDIYPNYAYYGAEDTGTYFLRLLRDGWTLKAHEEENQHNEFFTFEKRLNDTWTLRKFFHADLKHPVGRGIYYDRHELENRRSGEKIDGANWEWAELDRRRLVWAQNGKLFAGRLGTKDLNNVKELHDFNAMTFEPIAAPYY